MKSATFEYLVRAIYSAQVMSVNNDKEYTSYLSNVHEVTETLVQVTFNVKKVMFLMELTNFQQSDYKVHKKIWASMEEMLDETDDNDIPMDDIRKKNIKNFTAQGKPKKLHAFKTTITGKKMSDCCGCPVHCFHFDGTWCDIDPNTIRTVKTSKTRALLTGVESGDFIDPEGNLVSVDADFSRAAEVHDPVKLALKIEMKKIETGADYKDKEQVARTFITRFEREEREDE
jgi:hypothetical protein